MTIGHYDIRVDTVKIKIADIPVRHEVSPLTTLDKYLHMFVQLVPMLPSASRVVSQLTADLTSGSRSSQQQNIQH
jgi:hypothetical protein